MKKSSLSVVVERLSRRYGDGSAGVRALRGVSLRVEPGEFLSVMGQSGSGKSTLLNLIAGIDRPDAGRVLIDDTDLASLDDDARSDLRLASIGIVFQDFNLFPTFTVLENVSWPLEFLGVSARVARRRAQLSLGQVLLPESAFARRPAELSGGERQRVAIARALVTEPGILLADEPTGNLDSRTGQAILDLLRALNSERRLTVVLVTHSTFASTYGSRTIELRDGEIVAEARPSPGERVELASRRSSHG